MDGGSTAWFHLRGLNPFVFGETGIDHKELIFDRSSRLHFVRFGHLKDDVRLRNPPASSKSRGRGGILGIAFRRAGFDPVGDRLLLVGGETAVVGKMAILGVGVPGRHSPLAHDFADRISPADRFVIGRERERADLSRTVALDAAPVENSSDILGESHRSRRRRLVYSADVTAHRRRRWLTDRLARQQFIESRGEVVLRRLRTRNADVVLIVDPARDSG